MALFKHADSFWGLLLKILLKSCLIFYIKCCSMVILHWPFTQN